MRVGIPTPNTYTPPLTLLLPPVNPARLKAAESILDRQMGNVWEMFPPSLCNSNRLLARVQIEVVSRPLQV